MASQEPVSSRYCYRCKDRTQHTQTTVPEGPQEEQIRVICERCGGLSESYVREIEDSDRKVGLDIPVSEEPHIDPGLPVDEDSLGDPDDLSETGNWPDQQ